ncbi:MAG TPA: dihydroneopterin aldolase [Polyangiaceae bacterium]|jgi:dihydroneopterin aldolase|nr:dihydroneopterin aldolase [Polyangiaceae bacterium]
MDLIRIRGLEMDCIVGINPHERERNQRVHLDVAFGLDLSPAGRTGRIALTCNYDEIATEIIAVLKFRRFHLIEMATEELAAMLLGMYTALVFVEIRLDKPAALDGRARAASVEIHRAREAFPTEKRTTPSGYVELLLETRDASLTRVGIAPGKELVSTLPEGGRVLEWLAEGDVSRNGRVLVPHSPLASGPETATYRNTGSEPAVLFRCICPPPLDA